MCYKEDARSGARYNGPALLPQLPPAAMTTQLRNAGLWVLGFVAEVIVTSLAYALEVPARHPTEAPAAVVAPALPVALPLAIGAAHSSGAAPPRPVRSLGRPATLAAARTILQAYRLDLMVADQASGSRMRALSLVEEVTDLRDALAHQIADGLEQESLVWPTALAVGATQNLAATIAGFPPIWTRSDLQETQLVPQLVELRAQLHRALATL